jgi:hypothetical protein
MPSFSVTFRFYAQLNDFLPHHLRGRRLMRVLNDAASVRDTIGAFGIPPPEVDVIVINGMPRDFAWRLSPGDQVAVYPEFRNLDLGSATRAGSHPSRPLRFMADVHLGRLTAFLRLAGFDTIVLDDDAELARTAAREGRVLLTRDVELLKRGAVRHGYWVRSTDSERQLLEVADRFDLSPDIDAFSRCLRCNTRLRDMHAADVADRMPPRARATFWEFRGCPGCGRVYWKGSHYRRLEALVARIG